MESVLQKNIESELKARGIKLAEFARTSKISYRTLQDIMDKKSTARITTVAAIAAGFGVSPGKLLEDTEVMKKTTPPPKDAFETVGSFLSKVAALDETGRKRLVQFFEAEEERMEEARITPHPKVHKLDSESS